MIQETDFTPIISEFDFFILPLVIKTRKDDFFKARSHTVQLELALSRCLIRFHRSELL